MELFLNKIFPNDQNKFMTFLWYWQNIITLNSLTLQATKFFKPINFFWNVNYDFFKKIIRRITGIFNILTNIFLDLFLKWMALLFSRKNVNKSFKFCFKNLNFGKNCLDCGQLWVTFLKELVKYENSLLKCNL